MAGKQLDVKSYIGWRYQEIKGGTSPNDQGTALQLSFAYLTAPLKDTSVFRGIVTRTKAGP